MARQRRYPPPVRKPANPWTIIGWIALGAIGALILGGLLFIGGLGLLVAGAGS